MFTNSVTVTTKTKDIPMPDGTIINPVVNYEYKITDAGGAVVKQWQGDSPNPPPFDVSHLASGIYTLWAARINNLGVPVGAPAKTSFGLDQTITVPDTITATLA